jgi:hypothetical protein
MLDYIRNGIESPAIDLSVDDEGNSIAVPESILVEFDVYLDLPINNVVFYNVSRRFMVGGVWTCWQDDGSVSPGLGGWFLATREIEVAPGATHMEVRLEVADYCYVWCGVYGDGQCHSHAPLYDNVRIYEYHPPEPADFFVTNTLDGGSGSLRQAIIDANASSDRSVIAFGITGPGPHTISPLTPLPEIEHPTVIDGYRQGYTKVNQAGPYQPGSADLRIELSGEYLSYLLDYGLWVGGNGSAIRGLVINDFPGQGILLAADDCRIEGNYIGTDVSGTVAKPNRWGIAITDNHSGNVIGGSVPEARNIIAGHLANGIGTRSECTIMGNFIGIGADAVTPLGNTTEGVVISGPAAGCAVGGTNEGEGNLIAYNESGISVIDQATATISGNHIFSNDGSTDSLGIDLQGDGLRLANDAGDADAGPNDLQNYPVLTLADPGSGNHVRLVGSLESTPSAGPFSIEFFANLDSLCGTGCQGQRYLGSADVSTDGSGHADIDVTLNAAVAVAELITATATNSSGSTSEFSLPVVALNTAPGGGVVVEPVDSTTGTSPVQLTFDNVTSSGQTTLSTSDAGPAVGGSFIVGDTLLYYHIDTGAGFTDSVTVCISYDESQVPPPESALRLMHYDIDLDPDDWVDITSSLDVDNNRICGRTDHFSAFVVGKKTASGVGDTPGLPASFALHQNVPNPFNPTTAIAFDVPPGAGRVTVAVYDVTGRLVRTLADGAIAPGYRRVTWDGRNGRGQMVASGVYFYRMVSRTFTQTRKMVLLK